MPSNTRESFIVASSMDWNRRKFEQEVQVRNGNWCYVASPAELNAALEKAHPRYIFFLHWNWIVAEQIWRRFPCVCFHMTDVPYGRGGSPLQNLILRGHKSTFVSALRMVAELDAGPVYGKAQLSLEGSAKEIYERAADCSWRLIDDILTNHPTPVDQAGDVVRFQRRNPSQSILPREGDIPLLYDFIRMLDAPGYPHAFIDWGQFRLTLHGVELVGDELRVKGVLKGKCE